MSVVNLGFVIMEAPDPKKWTSTLEETIGFMNVNRADSEGVEFLRMDEAPFRYMVVKGEKEQLFASCYEMKSKMAFDELLSKVSASGVTIEHGDADSAKRRAVAGFASFQDPSGNRVELYYDRDADTPFTGSTEDGFPKSFVTGDMGLGHVVVPAQEHESTQKFYTEVMGFAICDVLTLPPFAENMPDQRVTFLHADNPRHHTLALYNFPHPAKVVHLMAELNSIDEVGYCLERVKKAGLPIVCSLGRHSNDNMVSFYFQTPGGVAFEIGYDGLQVQDWSQFVPTETTSGDHWGHEYNFPTPE